MREFLDQKYRTQSFEELLKVYFGDVFGSLSALDVGAGSGDFALQLIQRKKAFGIQDITVLDRDWNIDPSISATLEQHGVEFFKLDVKEMIDSHLTVSSPLQLPQNQFDIVCLNAVPIGGPNGFADQAVRFAIHTLKPKGLLVASFIEGFGDMLLREDIPQKYPIYSVKTFADYPRTDYTGAIRGVFGLSNLHVVLKNDA